MAKAKTLFVCSECGYETARWLGRCPDCGNWNTLTEQAPKVEFTSEKKLKRAPGADAQALRIDQIPDDALVRCPSGISELDRVLGGGIVEGSFVLVGGDPGIGKSTLLTQVCAHLSREGVSVLYVSGEESARQIKIRANRLGASEALLSARAHNASGSVIMCAIEGSRPLLTDVQALVATTVFGNPRRMASGVDQGRLALLLAVLEKRAGMRLYDKDVYINIAGGMSLTEPAADLALCAAVASSFRNRPTSSNWAVMGEVGLAGEVRAVAQAERRVAECMRLGFDHVLLPKSNLKNLRVPEGMHITGVETVSQAIGALGLFDN